MKPKIIQMQHGKNGDEVWVLLDNGKIFHKLDIDNGPTFWEERDYLDDIAKYFGEEKIKS